MLKKILAIWMTLLIALCAIPALAQADESIERIADGETRDFDHDGTEETLSFKLVGLDEYGRYNGFTIGIGDQTFTIDAIDLEGSIFAADYSTRYRYEPYRPVGTLFMVTETWPNSDPVTHCYLYTDQRLIEVGTIPALPENMSISKSDKITTVILASHLGTWNREADFVIAEGTLLDAEGYVYNEYHVCEAPRMAYPMGVIVRLLRDLPLLTSVYDTEPTAKLDAGQNVMLAATDDIRWLYVSGLEDGADVEKEYTGLDNKNGGWVRFETEGYEEYLIIDGEKVMLDDVFDGIFYGN